MTSYAEKIIQTFNQFNGNNLTYLDSFYDPDVEFTDPLVKISGIDNLKKYYQHSYSLVQSIRFDFSDIIQNQNNVMAPWLMHIQVKGLNDGQLYSVNGLSHLIFNKRELVIQHRDYLDLGEMIYEQIPIQGYIIKKIKKKLQGNFR